MKSFYTHIECSVKKKHLSIYTGSIFEYLYKVVVYNDIKLAKLYLYESLIRFGFYSNFRAHTKKICMCCAPLAQQLRLLLLLCLREFNRNYFQGRHSIEPNFDYFR